MRIQESLTKERLQDEYVEQKKSLADIALEHGCSRQRVYQLLRLFGIQLRGKSTARILAIRSNKLPRFQDHGIDDAIFDTWTAPMAWLLGVLFTDGNLYQGTGNRGKRVSITSVDVELLEKANAILGTSKPIARCVQSYDKSRHIYKIEFFRESMRQRLVELGMTERKSLTMKFPDVPRELQRHFIRGCWDGDGSVFVSNGHLRASFVTGSREFIDILAAVLCNAGIGRIGRGIDTSVLPVTVHVSNRGKNPSYSIKIDSRDALKGLYHYFYDDVEPSLFLQRKHDVFVTHWGHADGLHGEILGRCAKVR